MLTLGVVAPKSDLRCLICRAWCFTLSVWMKWRWEMARYILKTPLPRQWCVQSTRQLWFLSFSYLVYSRNYIFLWHLNVRIFSTKTTWNNMSQELPPWSGDVTLGLHAFLNTKYTNFRLASSVVRTSRFRLGSVNPRRRDDTSPVILQMEQQRTW